MARKKRASVNKKHDKKNKKNVLKKKKKGESSIEIENTQTKIKFSKRAKTNKKRKRSWKEKTPTTKKRKIDCFDKKGKETKQNDEEIKMSFDDKIRHVLVSFFFAQRVALWQKKIHKCSAAL